MENCCNQNQPCEFASQLEESEMNSPTNGVKITANADKAYVNFSLVINGQVVGVNFSLADATKVSEAMAEAVRSVIAYKEGQKKEEQV